MDYEIYVSHCRTVNGKNKTSKPYSRTRGWIDDNGIISRGEEPNARGGSTWVLLGFRSGRSVTGVARCSESDNFCYKTGRELAMSRAIELYKKELNVIMGINDE